MAGNRNKIAQLIDGLRECWPDLDLIPSEFTHPTVYSIMKFYKRFVSHLSIDFDRIIEVLIYDTSDSQYQDQYEAFTHAYILYCCVNRIYQNLELTNFDLISFTNIINPSEDKNLVNRASLLANFLYYCKTTLQDVIYPIKKNNLGELHSLVDLNSEVSHKNEELKRKAFCRAENINRKENLLHNIEVKENGLQIIQLQCDEIIKNLTEPKAELKFMEEELANLTGNVERHMNQMLKLESLIVDDYETIQAKRNEVEKKEAEEREELADRRKNIVQKTNSEAELLRKTELTNILHENFNSKLLGTLNTIEETSDENERLIKKIQSTRKTKNENLSSIVQLDQEIKELEEELLALELKSHVRDESSQNEAIQMEKERKEVANLLEKSTADAADLNKASKYVTECCEKYKERQQKQDQFYETLFAKYSEAKQRLDSKAVEVVGKLKEAVAETRSAGNAS